MSEGRVFWLAGGCAGCRAAPCVRLAENMRENRAASTFTQVKGMSADICKTVGLAYVGSNPTPATTQNCSSELVSAAFPSLSRKRSGQPGAFAGLRSFCRSARRADERAGGRWLRHGEYAEKLRPWMRHRRCGGCSGRKGGGPLGPASQIIPQDLIPAPVRRKPPYLYPADEIAALVHAAGLITTPAAAAGMQSVVSLIAASGLRLGEALGLDRDHVSL